MEQTIKLKILGKLRVNFNEVSYFPKIVNNYNNTKYFIVFTFINKVIDPRDSLFVDVIEVEHSSLVSLTNYIDSLDNLTNADLIIYNSAPTQNTPINNINVNTISFKFLELEILTNNQTVFYIAENLTVLETQVFLNGQKLRYIYDYYLSSNSITFTNSDVSLSPSDVVEIYYVN